MRHTIRQGMSRGRGSGYRNIIRGHDKRVHTESGRGLKQIQKINFPYIVKPYTKEQLIRRADAEEKRWKLIKPTFSNETSWQHKEGGIISLISRKDNTFVVYSGDKARTFRSKSAALAFIKESQRYTGDE